MKAGFREYLETQRQRAMRTLLEKAYVANRLAKLSRGEQRSRLYELKCQHISQAIVLSVADIICDSVLGSSSRIIGISSRQGYRFHVPLERLSPAAREHFHNSLEAISIGAAA